MVKPSGLQVRRDVGAKSCEQEIVADRGKAVEIIATLLEAPTLNLGSAGVAAEGIAISSENNATRCALFGGNAEMRNLEPHHLDYQAPPSLQISNSRS